MQDELAVDEKDEIAIVPMGKSSLASFLESKFSQYASPRDYYTKKKKAKAKRKAERIARRVNR